MLSASVSAAATPRERMALLTGRGPPGALTSLRCVHYTQSARWRCNRHVAKFQLDDSNKRTPKEMAHERLTDLRLYAPDLAKRPELWQELYEIQKQLNQDLTDWQGANPDAPATRALTSTPAVQLCDQLLQQLRERALGGDEQAMAQARYLLDKKSDAKHASRGLGTDSALASTASAAGQALVFKQVDPKPEIGIRSSATSQQPPLNFWESFIDKCSRAWDVLSDRRSTLTPMWRWGAFKAGYVAKSRVKRVLLIDRCDVKPEALMHMKTTTEAGLRAISAATMQRLEALSEQLQDLEIEARATRPSGERMTMTMPLVQILHDHQRRCRADYDYEEAEDDDDYFWEDDDDFRVAPIIEPTGPGRSTTIIKPSRVTTKHHQAVAAATAAASKPSGVAGTRLGWDDSSDSGFNTIGSAGSEYAVEGQETEEEAFAGEDHMYISHASLQEP